MRRPQKNILFPYTTLFRSRRSSTPPASQEPTPTTPAASGRTIRRRTRSEEHTSELQSRGQLVCRLLLEKKKIHRHRSSVRYLLGRSEDKVRSRDREPATPT